MEINNINNYKYLLIDCDGTLADTQKCHCEAYNASFKFYNIPFNSNDWYKYSQEGNKNLEQNMILNKGYKHSDFKKISKMKSNILNKYLDLYMKPNYKLINYIKHNIYKHKFILVSNGRKKSIYNILYKLNILQYFLFILTNEDFNNAKPNPEPYLTAINKLQNIYNNINKQDCVIIEDNEVGFQSAINANIDYMNIKNF